ncbi:protein kinase domain-containing protein [Engelhardtia mirabilis]|uniref:Serine/threonine-protein kinase PrkC n=1 Tax=Engelhardtia mirabilis TaxID=2528011 RepID=A0A518BRC7_9BACT|nr:Serine/threonine-protein kinase PrkC [Planctomycetes bacterium Pla133]QDV03854.1 Serine/threonine-protein kinase PrkC [Planctomycetes bacterium Pla86]
MAADPPVPDPAPQDGLADTRAEELYDLYLEAALAGEMREPRDFLARAGVGDGPGVDDLVARLRQIQQLVGARPRREASAGLPFDRLGEFRLLEALGSGAMGVVYLAEQTSLGRLVALKVIREELAGTLGAEQRFEREAKALARIQHPGVVRLFGFGTDAGARYLAMELVPGQSLAELMAERGPLPPVQVAQWGLELAGALARVHNADLLHRDVKPSNVRIHEEGYAVLVDFGLSRSRDVGTQERSGGFAGSLGYASPEQVRGNRELGPETDVYSLGATLYHALSGRPAFEAQGIEALLQAILREEPTPLGSIRPGIPKDLATIVHHAMSKDPERRYRSAYDMAADFEAVLALRPIRARPPAPLERAAKWARREPAAAAGLGIATVAILALLAMVALQKHFNRVEREADARAALEEARLAVIEYADDREAMRSLDFELRALAQAREYRFVTDEERSSFAAIVDQVEEARRRREGVAFLVGELLARAQRLDPGLEEEAGEVLQSLLLEKWQDAVATGDSVGQRLFEQELRRATADGRLDELPFPTATLVVSSPVPGARAWLFRLEELDEIRPDGERRQVCVPVGPTGLDLDQPDLPLGCRALRLSSAFDDQPWNFEATDLLLEVDGEPIDGGAFVAGSTEDTQLRVGDRIVSVDRRAVWDGLDAELAVDAASGSATVGIRRGGQTLELEVADLSKVELLEPDTWLTLRGGRALRWREGQRESVDVPPGLPWRTTANPQFASRACELELGVEVPGLRRGLYVVVVTAPGCRPLRAAVGQGDTEPRIEIELEPRPLEFAPPGFVHTAYRGSVLRESWPAEHETTAEQYLPFLEDVPVRAQIDAALAEGDVIRIPRSGGTGTIFWERDEGAGTVELPPDWTGDMPVIGISYDDATAYAAWRTEHGDGGTYFLGDQGRRAEVAVAFESRLYSWGSRFDPRFANTCFSRPRAGVEPVMSYPVDESPTGVYDLCGNAAEFIDDWFDAANGYRHAAGGAWGQAPAAINGVLGGYGHKPHRSTGETGLRLMWRPEEDR